jgi:hypothetical protein
MLIFGPFLTNKLSERLFSGLDIGKEPLELVLVQLFSKSSSGNVSKSSMESKIKVHIYILILCLHFWGYNYHTYIFLLP